jgi:ankyrin repeat protein
MRLSRVMPNASSKLLPQPHHRERFCPGDWDIVALTFNGKVDRVRELVEADPSLARTTPDGDSLLLSLPRDVEETAIEIARVLLSRGADSTVKDSTGKTPAERAERLAMFDLARLLKAATERGACST